MAACLPLTLVFVGTDFLRPVLAAVLLSVGCSWASRRAGAGPISTLLLSLVAWALLMAFAFLPQTLLAGFVPTLDTLAAGQDLWARGVELVRSRPAPAFPEAGLLLLTATGAWWTAHAVEGLVFRLQAPLRAIAFSLLLWSVPLAIVRTTDGAWLWAVPLLLAAAGLLLSTSVREVDHWGPRVGPDGASALSRRLHFAAGWPMAGTAIVLGSLLAGLVPGFGESAWVQVRNLGGTTFTTNPMVTIRANLVSLSDEPVARVISPRPVYLRLTSLEMYGEAEEWTSAGIRGTSIGTRLPPETALPYFQEATVTVEAESLGRGVLVPAPYHPIAIEPPEGTSFLYDRGQATLTVDRSSSLRPGDRYTVTAAIPAPPPEALREVSVEDAPPEMIALPSNVPDDVGDVARRIVAAAGAQNAFDQALAIQEELRSWEYSLTPPQGHSASAMLSFLESRQGYCEQFAGTMAVMLRTLGIPARVAVGYTPGELVDQSGEWIVRNENAHAWVEVLFPGVGWVPFEPTPRSDGNVLTPTLSSLTPIQTDAQRAGSLSAMGLPGPLLDHIPGEELPHDDIDGQAGEAGDAGSTAGRNGLGVGMFLGLLLLVGVATAALTLLRRPAPNVIPPARVLTALASVERVGRGVGVRRTVSETDQEFLGRLAPEVRAARTLAVAATRARYGSGTTPQHAEKAEAAADAVDKAIVGHRGRVGRSVVRLRGGVGLWWDRARHWLLRARAVRNRHIEVGRAADSGRAADRLMRRRREG